MLIISIEDLHVSIICDYSFFSVNRFQDYLVELDISGLYSHHPVMLHWCCTSNIMPYNLAKAMVRIAILNDS